MTGQESSRSTWLSHLLSTAPADRARAEAAVRQLYEAAGFPAPRHVVWYDSPRAASWAVALLAAPHSMIWRDRLSGSLSRDDRAEADRARGSLGARLGTDDWNTVLANAGAPRGSHLQWPPDPRRMFSSALLDARYGLAGDIAALMRAAAEEDDLSRAETWFWGSNRGALPSPIHCPTTDMVLGQSWYADYSMAMMATDAARVPAGGSTPPLLRAAWDVAQSAGLWWPFEGLAVLTDRPAELYVNERQLLHRADGPALTYRDGWRVFAWNGKAVPERWIMEPTAVPAREFRGFDPTFAKHVASRGAAASPKPKKRPKAPSITGVALPTDPSERLAMLRAHVGGPLPRYERYHAGEHRTVWAELVALGAEVREEPHAADALAVAYATMERVAANVDTIVTRLQALGYTFTAGPRPASPRDRTARPHRPPSETIQKELAAFEKSGGPLPLSLRAFYEVVGEVNLMGRHPTIAPASGRIAPDPLVVYAFDEGAVEFDDEDDDHPSAITIAPDDLHKADVSGGDAYEMAIPDPRADGELLNERHEIMFVDYLRLCVQYGGFPGYEGQDSAPPEITTLRDGLLAF